MNNKLKNISLGTVRDNNFYIYFILSPGETTHILAAHYKMI